MKRLKVVNVFPISDLVFFPSTNLPLKIFEGRYRKMLKDSIDMKRPIAVIPQSAISELEDKNVVSGFGHPVILSQSEDGSSLISLQGLGRIRLGRILRESPYLVCEGVPLGENVEVANQNRFRMNRLRRLLRAWSDSNLLETSDSHIFKRRLKDDAFVIDFISSYFLTDVSEQQELLSLDNFDDRIFELIKYIDRAESDGRRMLEDTQVQFV